MEIKYGLPETNEVYDYSTRSSGDGRDSDTNDQESQHRLWSTTTTESFHPVKMEVMSIEFNNNRRSHTFSVGVRQVEIFYVDEKSYTWIQSTDNLLSCRVKHGNININTLITSWNVSLKVFEREI